MNSVSMTDRWVNAVRVDQGRSEFSDAVTPGLRLRVSKRSKKWTLLTRKFGKQTRIAIGDYPAIGLREARGVAAELKSATSDSDLITSISQMRAKPSPMLSQVCLDYVEQMKAKGKVSHHEYERALVKSPLSICAYMNQKLGAPAEVRDVGPEHVAEWLHMIYERGPSQAKHCRAYLHAVFEWAISAKFDYSAVGGVKDYGVSTNPVSATPSINATKPRNRVLSIEELSTLWRLLPEEATPEIAIGMRMVVAMGGLRLSEIFHCERKWFKDGWLTLPETKNGREHSVPLTQYAQELHNEASRRGRLQSKFLFPHQFEKSKPLPIASPGAAIRRIIKKHKLAPFQARDIRRTMKSHLLDGGFVEEREIDIWHNHGQKSDIARKHYTWAEYRELKLRVADQIDEFLVRAMH